MGPWLFALAFFLAPLCSTAEKGYVLLFPDVLVPETTLQLKLNLFDVDGDGEVLISLSQVQHPTWDPNNTRIIASKKVRVQGERDVSIALDIPALNEATAYYYNYFLQINGSFGDFVFTKEARVQMKESNFRVFVQTDKPVYKPGNLVQFRLLVVDSDLRPLSDAKGEVLIEDPSGTRMANWLTEEFSKGINQYSFQLIDEPPLGNWAIIAKVNGQTSRTSFEVKEYVLPKFEVVITPPPYVLESHDQITWKICGKYTYGKPVAGILRVNASYNSYYYNRARLHVPSIVTVEEVSDCYNYTLTLADLNRQKGNETYHYDTNRVRIQVELEEAGTGNTEKAEHLLDRSLMVDVSLTFEDKEPGYFKPGFPIYRTLKVTRPDDTPAPNVPVELCYTTKNERRHLCWRAESLYSACRTYTSDSEGRVKFGVPMLGQDVTSIAITANYTSPRGPIVGNYDASSTLTLNSWFSPSQSFIQIQPLKSELDCGEKESFSVLFTGESSELPIYYQIISKGRLLIQDKMETCPTCSFQVDPDDRFIYAPSSKEEEEDSDDKLKFFKKMDDTFPVPAISRRLNYANVSFTPTFDLAPSASLLVYYVRPDGEIVADSTTLAVSKCLKNQVDFEFSSTQDYPGSPLSYKLATEPSSWCGVAAVDKSLYLMSSQNKLDISKLYDYLNTLTYKSYLQQKTNRPCPSQPRCYAKYYQAGKSTRSKRSVLRPGPYISPPPYQAQTYLDSIEAFEKSGTKILTNLKVEVRPCDQNYYSGGSGDFNEHRQYALSGPPRAPVAAAFGGAAPGLPGAPAPEMRVRGGSSSAKAVVSLRYNFPETWLWDLVYVPDGKLTKETELPHTLTSWEGNAVCVHPQKGIAISAPSNVTGFQPFFVSFNMPYSVIRGEKVPLVVSIANYLDTCLPIKISLDEASEGGYDLEGAATHSLCLCGNKVETHTFRIIPKTIGSLNMTVRGLTAPDTSVCEGKDFSSQPARDAESKALLVEPEGIAQETTLSSMVCPQGDEPTSFKFDLPEGDNMVPDSTRMYLAVSGDLLGSALRNLDRLVSKPTGCGEQTLVRYLPNILVLNYLAVTNQKLPELEGRALANIRAGYQRIMSFKRNDGSYAPWGNSDHEGSLQLTSLVVMTNHEASKYIDVDMEDLARSRSWILSKQHPIDGCFRAIGFVHTAYLRDTHKLSTITALALSALIESGFRNSTVESDAISCIKLDTTPPVYTLAIAAYAFSLAGREAEARQYLALLEEKSFTKDGYKYWLPSAESSSSGPRDLTMDESSIEVAGYVAMAMIQLDGREGISKVLPVIRGLVSRMNINGGFYSSQDTLVALRALSKYSSLLTSEDLARDLNYVFTPGSQAFHVDDTNRLVQQMEKLVEPSSDLQVAATGQGCGLVQIQAKYNVYNPPKPNAFQLTASVEQNPEKCHHVVKVCYDYLQDGLSNMVIMEIKMVSGYEPLPITLDLLKDENKIKKYEYKNQAIAFYFDGMSRGEKCLEFIVTRTLPVEDVKPANIKISDYYKQELSATIEYEVKNTSCR